MTLTLDTITLGVPRVEAACAFYESAFARTADHNRTTGLDLYGTGRLAFRSIDALAADVGADSSSSGFRGFVLGSIVSQPGEVRVLLETAATNGATVVKPPRKQLFGEFTAVYRAPDGAVWKLAASSKKDASRIPDPPTPTETAVYLGVTKPTASRRFYEAVGMSADHDYGDRFIDFTAPAGVCRLGLLSRRDLAKDAGVDERGEGFCAVVLEHAAGSPDEVDALIAAAESAGGRVIAATDADRGEYAGHFADPDGYYWKVSAGISGSRRGAECRRNLGQAVEIAGSCVSPW